jgi:hypothetical protein
MYHVTARTASLPPWTRSEAAGTALLSYLIYVDFVGLDHGTEMYLN